MSSSYPGALDNFAEASPSFMSDPDTTGRVHSRRHDDVESAIEAMQAAAGILPPRFRFDESVGRRLFATDKNNAGREQMVYGDTGWRDVTALLTPIAGATINFLRLRRLGAVVMVEGRVTTDGALTTGSVQIWTLPNGFRQTNPQNAAQSPWLGLQTTVINIASRAEQETFALKVAVTGASYTDGQSTWTTTDPWPASLPGSASGTIPTADTLLPADGPADIDPDIPTGLTE